MLSAVVVGGLAVIGVAYLIVSFPILTQGGLPFAIVPRPTVEIADPGAIVFEADAAYRAGRFDDAVQDYQRAVRSGLNDGDTLGKLAFSLVRAGSVDDAVDTARQAIVIDPDSARAHAALAMALTWSGEPGEAVVAGRRAIELAPEASDAFAVLAEALSSDVQFEDGLAMAQRAVGVDSENPLAHRTLGYALERLGRYSAATREYRAALELAPGWTFINLDLAPVLASQGLADEAIEVYEAFNFGAPQDARGHTGIGRVYFREQRYGRAIEAFRMAIEIDPNHAPAFRLTGWSHYATQRYDRAAISFERALELDPDNASTLNGLGWAYVFLDNPEGARPLFVEALEIDPDSELAQQGLAKVDGEPEATPQSDSEAQ